MESLNYDMRKLLLLTDYYEFSMANGYFLNGIAEKTAVFDYFYRYNPFQGEYAIFVGIQHLLDIIDDFQFLAEDIEYLKTYPLDPRFLEYIAHWKNHLNIKAFQEGSVVFPFEPLIEVKGPLAQCQLIETVLLNSINFPTLCATKANRMWLASGKQTILEFGARRAQGPDGANTATYASLVGGASATSNVLAAKSLGIQATGTQAHSWITSYPTELEAFKAYAEIYPDNVILLVDTYDTLKSGIPNAIKVGLELKRKGKILKGIRIDSGDLAKLSQDARRMLDTAGLKETKIVISNDVDEHLIEIFKKQGGIADIWGIGTKLVTCYNQPALGGVYKMVEFEKDPRIKISDDLEKINIPSVKTVIRLFKNEVATNKLKNREPATRMIYDVILHEDDLDISKFKPNTSIKDKLELSELENPYLGYKVGKLLPESYDSFEVKLNPVMENGKRIHKQKISLKEARDTMTMDISRLGDNYSRLHEPEEYQILITKRLTKIREELQHKYKK